MLQYCGRDPSKVEWEKGVRRKRGRAEWSYFSPWRRRRRDDVEKKATAAGEHQLRARVGGSVLYRRCEEWRVRLRLRGGLGLGLGS